MLDFLWLITHYGRYMAFPAVVVALMGNLELALVLTVISFISLFTYQPILNLSLEKDAEKKAEKEAQEKIDAIYSICLERGIRSIETQKDKETLLLIAKNAGINDYNHALEAFNKGKKEYDAKEKEEKRKIEDEKRQKELKLKRISEEDFRKIAVKADTYRGKDKYLLPHYAELQSIQRYVENDKQERANREIPYANAKKSDPYIIGGIASGIAGSGAGLAAASSVAQSNAKSEAKATEYNNAIRTINAWSSVTSGYSLYYSSDIEEYDKFIAWFKHKLSGVLIDDADQKQYAELIKLRVVEKKVLESGYMEIQVETSMTAKPTLLDCPASLDGWYQIDVYKEKRLVGYANYTPYGAGETNLDNVGFGTSQKSITTTLVKPIGNNVLSADEDYTYQYAPLALWLVEAKNFDDYEFKSERVRRAVHRQFS